MLWGFRGQRPGCGVEGGGLVGWGGSQVPPACPPLYPRGQEEEGRLPEPIQPKSSH